jgi:hypothetical protein
VLEHGSYLIVQGKNIKNTAGNRHKILFGYLVNYKSKTHVAQKKEIKIKLEYLFRIIFYKLSI